MQNRSPYNLYRFPSKVFFFVFMLCMCAWISRIIRVNPLVFSGQLLSFRTAEWPVWMEHFASALGLPSLSLSVAYWIAARPDPKKVNERTPILAFFIPILLAFITVVLLIYGEAGHEIEQTLLTKHSNYGQYLADRCLPADTIHALALCASEYQATVYAQGLADFAGTITFICLLAYSTWHLALAHIRIGNNK
ncbi:hypothetical protein [Rhodoferax sp. GW822-FHT02A01]|uniref:hypothetical protein n=1 Tax=Rhodoferax sp. GW822-FHT02A01 TaxID=3141537 RepID=UPI00315DE8E0